MQHALMYLAKRPVRTSTCSVQGSEVAVTSRYSCSDREGQRRLLCVDIGSLARGGLGKGEEPLKQVPGDMLGQG